MVFYRKYRPQKIEELDSQSVREALSSVFSKSTYPHAFLFTGPKGLGKTSAARIVAKIVNCEKRKKGSIEPCNKCDQCTSITNGNNIDIFEIDGASNRGIDEIRDLRDKIKLSPARASKKIYIIDEVHMLTTEAFNALLKTLEEPPSHALFILCTTEPHKVPGTIVSRCFHVNFKKATKEELVRSLQRIVKAEKLNVEKPALVEISRFSEGSFRDGVKILEEITLHAGRKKITKELVESIYKTSNIDTFVLEMLKNLKTKDTKKAFALISELNKLGIDAKFFLEQLINKLHLLLLEKVGIGEAEKTEQDLDFNLSEIKKLVRLLIGAHKDSKYALFSQMPLEMVIVEWSEEERLIDNFQDLENTPQTLTEDKPLKASTSGSLPIKQSVDGNKLWNELIEKVKPYNHSLAGVLRGCAIKKYDDKQFIIEAGFKFHKDRLDEAKSKKILEEVLKDLTGKNLIVNISLRG